MMATEDTEITEIKEFFGREETKFPLLHIFPVFFS